MFYVYLILYVVIEHLYTKKVLYKKNILKIFGNKIIIIYVEGLSLNDISYMATKKLYMNISQ